MTHENATTLDAILADLESNPRLLKAAETGRITGWSRPLVYKRVEAGDLPGVRIGRSGLRIASVALARYLRENASPFESGRKRAGAGA